MADIAKIDHQLIERSHYPDHIVAEAYALIRSGYSSRRTAAELDRRYPGDAPAESTIRSWSKALADSAQEETWSREAHIIELSDEVLARYVREIEEKPGPISNQEAMTVNAIRGTMADKQMRRQQLGSGGIQGPIVIAVFPGEEPPTTIEGHATEVE